MNISRFEGLKVNLSDREIASYLIQNSDVNVYCPVDEEPKKRPGPKSKIGTWPWPWDNVWAPSFGGGKHEMYYPKGHKHGFTKLEMVDGKLWVEHGDKRHHVGKSLICFKNEPLTVHLSPNPCCLDCKLCHGPSLQRQKELAKTLKWPEEKILALFAKK